MEIANVLEMKNRIYWTLFETLFFNLALGLLIGCQKPVDLDGERSFVINLQLPAPLAKDSGRYQRFLARSRHLVIAVGTKGGVSTEQIYAPGQWENISLNGLKFPVDENDSLSLTAQFWDKKKDGLPRQSAALSGKKQWSARDLEATKPEALTVKLELKVSAKEYD